MKIEKEHFIDAGEKDAEGYYDYYYEGDTYEIALQDVSYSGRCYIDSPTEFSFLSKTMDGKRKPFQNIPYDDTNFQECIKYFRDKLGFQDFKVLAGKDGAA